mmetsp:Transcript_37456/g.87056  ORF Transcript_37456/g.87056 Transcript_37456/m.87056 type:complete len:128 (-) Transcript_37456:104-487(-)|eukprot:CAMPEP_0171095022 /NCGR_PEP_ID=MMETSP0766_2-20121228/42942_1 /TAXON_ID=439317 /ORGANISM="Gambierdiscus australes, Strain CAWD 149" /LENGTH=127 /DNA_ID=CAMNT_0011553783 /DNA_START=64 /DNA_END=447 /DNA_ORIENTATION=+
MAAAQALQFFAIAAFLGAARAGDRTTAQHALSPSIRGAAATSSARINASAARPNGPMLMNTTLMNIDGLPARSRPYHVTLADWQEEYSVEPPKAAGDVFRSAARARVTTWVVACSLAGAVAAWAAAV